MAAPPAAPDQAAHLPLEALLQQQFAIEPQVQITVPSAPPATPPAFAHLPKHLPAMTRLTTPMYDGSENPAPWLTRLEDLANMCHLIEQQRIWYAAFHLTGKAGRWYMNTTMATPMTEWAWFTDGITRNFGPTVTSTASNTKSVSSSSAYDRSSERR